MTLEQHTTPEKVAALLCVSRDVIWRMCRDGTLPSVQVGKFRRIPVSAVEEWLAGEGRGTVAPVSDLDERRRANG